MQNEKPYSTLTADYSVNGADRIVADENHLDHQQIQPREEPQAQPEDSTEGQTEDSTENDDFTPEYILPESAQQSVNDLTESLSSETTDELFEQQITQGQLDAATVEKLAAEKGVTPQSITEAMESVFSGLNDSVGSSLMSEAGLDEQEVSYVLNDAVKHINHQHEGLGDQIYESVVLPILKSGDTRQLRKLIKVARDAKTEKELTEHDLFQVMNRPWY